MSFEIKRTTRHELPSLVSCYRRAFNGSLSSAMGSPYVLRTLEWYLSSDSNFLFHVTERDTGRMVGFCGGMINDGVTKRGSTSEIIQFSFDVGVRCLLRRPWVLFHPEMRSKYALAWKNIRRRLKGRTTAVNVYSPGEVEPFVGLVVIAIDPDFQNRGLSGLLLREFEETARSRGIYKTMLSVKTGNKQAIKAYQKCGWLIDEYRGLSISMAKRF